MLFRYKSHQEHALAGTCGYGTIDTWILLGLIRALAYILDQDPPCTSSLGYIEGTLLMGVYGPYLGYIEYPLNAVYGPYLGYIEGRWRV